MGRKRINPEELKKINRNVSIPIYVDTFFKDNTHLNLSEIVSNYLIKYINEFDKKNK